MIASGEHQIMKRGADRSSDQGTDNIDPKNRSRARNGDRPPPKDHCSKPRAKVPCWIESRLSERAQEADQHGHCEPDDKGNPFATLNHPVERMGDRKDDKGEDSCPKGFDQHPCHWRNRNLFAWSWRPKGKGGVGSVLSPGAGSVHRSRLASSQFWMGNLEKVSDDPEPKQVIHEASEKGAQKLSNPVGQQLVLWKLLGSDKSKGQRYGGIEVGARDRGR